MTIDPEFFQEARESIDLYETRTETYAERWKKEHDEAMECINLEELIAFGITIFDLINRLDEIWRRKVHENRIPYNPDVDAAIETLYAKWMGPFDRVMAQVNKFRQAGYNVAGEQEFISAHREVKGILTSASDFFTDEKLADLKDNAIDEHLRGNLIEFQEMGD